MMPPVIWLQRKAGDVESWRDVAVGMPEQRRIKSVAGMNL
jgi:uncharacterized protein YaeQ